VGNKTSYQHDGTGGFPVGGQGNELWLGSWENAAVDATSSGARQTRRLGDWQTIYRVRAKLWKDICMVYAMLLIPGNDVMKAVEH